jgi:hypothetical protein
MSRLPLLNLCLIVSLLTILSNHRSITLLRPTESIRAVANFDAPRIISLAPIEAIWSDTALPDGLMTSIGFLNRLWQRTMILKEWLLESETAYLDRIQVSSQAEADLVEARSHVENAEMLRWSMDQKPRAKAELDRAESYLRAAQPFVKNDMAPKLNTVREKIADAVQGVQADMIVSEAWFDNIKLDLDHLIETLHFVRT